MKEVALPAPGTNLCASDAVLAQSIAAWAGWLIDGTGDIYDSRTVIISESLFELGRGMRQLNWFTAAGAVVTGVDWGRLPPKSEIADTVREVLR